MNKLISVLVLLFAVSNVQANEHCLKAQAELDRTETLWACRLINPNVKFKAKYRLADSELCVASGVDDESTPYAVVVGQESLLREKDLKKLGEFKILQVEARKDLTANPDWGHFKESKSKLKLYVRRGDIMNDRRDITFVLDKDYGVLEYKKVVPRAWRDEILVSARYGCEPVQ